MINPVSEDPADFDAVSSVLLLRCTTLYFYALARVETVQTTGTMLCFWVKTMTSWKMPVAPTYLLTLFQSAELC